MEIKQENPGHVSIIMDGNGRWAEAKGKERNFGHSQGTESVRRTFRAAIRHGVHTLTLYVFSTENWGRPAEEIEALMELFCESVVREAEALQQDGVRIVAIGDRERLPEKVRQHLATIEQQTEAGKNLTVLLAINYSARWELTRMAQRVAREACEGGVAPEEISEERVKDNLATAGFSDPDLLIRTGGEQRLSNFLLWQLAYSELYFTDTYWPDFSEADFDRAIETFQQRERRFGQVK